MATCDPSVTTFLSGLLTPVIALVALSIGYRQWRTAQNKLKLDLFERRLSVYDAANKLVASILTHGKVEDPDLHKFLVGTHAAKWLLSAGVALYLEKELYAKALDLQCLDHELPGLAGAPRTENIHRQSEIKTWLIAQYKVLDAKFAPYLSVGH